MNNIVFFLLILTIGNSRVEFSKELYIHWISVVEVQASLSVDQAAGEVLRKRVLILLVACSLGEAGVQPWYTPALAKTPPC